MGSAQSFGGPAYSALIPSLVPKENLPNAIALNSIQFNLGRVIGPALGGITLTALGAAWCFGLNGVSFVAVIISLYIIHAGFTPGKSTESMLVSMKQGIGFIRVQEGMKPLIVLSFLMTMVAIPLITFLPVFAKEVLHGTPATFTALLCSSGVGSICGALMVAGMAKTKNQGRTALLMLLVLGVATIVFAQSTSTILSCAMIFSDAGAAMITVFASITSCAGAGGVITEDGMLGPCDERLQRGISRRHADRDAGGGEIDPHLLRPVDHDLRRRADDSAGPLFSAGAEANHAAVRSNHARWAWWREL